MDLPVHVAKINGGQLLFLRKNQRYCWTLYSQEGETQLGIEADVLADAFAKAAKLYRYDGFKYLECGFVYTLPVRDEVGSKALFCQMAKSYQSSNGTYFDDNLAHQCRVDNASQEALDLLREALC